MKPTVKSLFILLIIAIAALYLVGCSSAEQTTAKIAYAQGDFEKAEAEFLKETQQNPSNEEAWFYLAMSRVQLNKIDAADLALKEYKKIGKNTFQSELIDTWGRKFDEGYNAFKSASSTMDTGLSLPQYQKAIDLFKIALVLQPDSTIAKTNIDIINGKINTIALKPILDRGVEMEKAGDYAGAIEQYKMGLNRVLKGGANYEIVIYDLGVAYLKWGEKERDEKQAINPDDVSYKEKYELALPYLEELTKSTDKANKKLAYELLVQVYGNLGMNEKALEAIKIRDELNK
jgi:tetratricopeptide (TPR) repeat protein